MKESVITFDKIAVLIDYLFIYLDHIKVKDKLKDKKNYSSAYEIHVFFVLNIYFTYYLMLLLFIY